MVFDRLEVIGFSAAVSLTREGVDHINKAVDRTKVMAYAIVVGIFRSYVFKVEWEERSCGTRSYSTHFSNSRDYKPIQFDHPQEKLLRYYLQPDRVSHRS